MSNIRGKKHIRVALIAPPWLKIPPEGYGGIENVLGDLIPELINLGVDVELFTVEKPITRTFKSFHLYRTEQFEHIHRPYYESLPIPTAHIQSSLNAIKEDGSFDLIHDHNPYIGPAMLANLGKDLPPVLHTIHGPPFTSSSHLKLGIPDNRLMWQQLSKAERLFFVTISQSARRQAPKVLKAKILPAVHNGINPAHFIYSERKSDYFITLARAHPDKGQRYAVQACIKGGYKLKLAGVVAGLTTPRQVMVELANPGSNYRGLIDFRYFSDYIFPYLDGKQIEYVGDVKGQRKQRLLANAKALLFPIRWEEPFGVAPIEALASGTPVIAMNRGAMPEIIKHGVNGFLAKSQREFESYMKRVDQINPEDCKKSVEEKFSARIMAENYIDRYNSVLDML